MIDGGQDAALRAVGRHEDSVGPPSPTGHLRLCSMRTFRISAANIGPKRFHQSGRSRGRRRFRARQGGPRLFGAKQKPKHRALSPGGGLNSPHKQSCVDAIKDNPVGCFATAADLTFARGYGPTIGAAPSMPSQRTGPEWGTFANGQSRRVGVSFWLNRA